MKPVKHLLFVDDEEDVLKILVNYFSDSGYRLHVAHGKEEAIRIIQEVPIDLILADLRLKDGLGSEVLAFVKETRPQAIRMLTSGYLDIHYGRVHVDQNDGTLYFSKPWDFNMLKNVIAERLG